MSVTTPQDSSTNPTNGTATPEPSTRIATHAAAGPDRAVDTNVVIVGAGPIGLTVACALARHGVSYRIVEARTEPEKTSRANNLWSRPQELLDSIGVRDALAKDAYVVRRSNIVINGRALQQAIDEASSPFPRPLYSKQDVIEATLADLTARAGTRVERGCRVVGLAQDDTGVEVLVAAPDRDETAGTSGRPAADERIRCRYVVGADGSSGYVHEALGLDIPTEEFEQRAIRQIDARLHWRRSNEQDQMWWIPYHHGFAGILPISGGYHRVFFIEDEADMEYRDPTLEEMQSHLREIAGDPSVTLSDPIWFSHGHFKHGTAPTYAQGRVFLAGDAGHYTLPIGGQGMNAGLHDAVGLGWRLAMTLDGAGGPAVLDSYSAERHPVHAELDERQGKEFRQLMYRSRLADRALGLATDKLPGVITGLFGGGDVQQIEVSYPDSTLSEEHLASPLANREGPAAGSRAPDAELIAEDGSTTTIFEHVYGPDGDTWGWCLLGFDGGPTAPVRGDGSGLDPLGGALEQAAATPWVHPRLVVADGAAVDASPASVPRLFDLDGTAHDAFGLHDRPALVLVRPDGHIAFRSGADRFDLLQDYLRRISSAETVSAAG